MSATHVGGDNTKMMESMDRDNVTAGWRRASPTYSTRPTRRWSRSAATSTGSRRRSGSKRCTRWARSSSPSRMCVLCWAARRSSRWTTGRALQPARLLPQAEGRRTPGASAAPGCRTRHVALPPLGARGGRDPRLAAARRAALRATGAAARVPRAASHLGRRARRTRRGRCGRRRRRSSVG